MKAPCCETCMFFFMSTEDQPDPNLPRVADLGAEGRCEAYEKWIRRKMEEAGSIPRAERAVGEMFFKDNDLTDGLCQRFPPARIPGSSSEENCPSWEDVFPRTAYWWWCGEHKYRAPKEWQE